jgi:hypothetical protein
VFPNKDEEEVGRGDIGFVFHAVIFSGDKRLGEELILDLVVSSRVNLPEVEEDDVEGLPFL